MKKLAISANRTLHIFDVEDLIYFSVSTEKTNSSDIVLSGNRRLTVHKSVSELYQLFHQSMAITLKSYTRCLHKSQLCL